ncbi:uncharacterized protein LDX57_004209 [Aspergillus melleus]|uniref:uncharacterized protein n=1 Tax=Aspergillus melleus TaxID=138277 RepID=UPI001E8EF24A|nr:uncharacterized protein LDX57_004209 [Aspergillus melleus]KAH8426472.1 hypothetical protein LDX57_004209 [Aspergillus melleus]
MANMPTPEDIAWMKAHIDDSLVPDIIACCAVCAAASVIVLALRIWSRLQTRRQLVLSDYMVICSVVFFIAFCTVFALSTRYGAGRHAILTTDPADIRMLAILNILNPILYGMATAFVKWSILALYLTIFPQKLFQYWVQFLVLINTLNAIAIVLVSCLQCRPLQALWNPAVGGTCIDFSNFSLFNTSFNFVLDLVILLSPLRLVTKLNLSRRKKILLSLNFALGGGACVVAAIRLPYARRVGGTSNPSWDMIPGGLLCVVEVTVALLCASLPIYRPLFQRLTSSGPATNSGGDSKDRPNSHGAGYYLGRDKQVNTRITASSGRHSSHRSGINITENISMMTHTYVNGKWAPVTEDDDEARLVPGPKQGSPSTTANNSVTNL